MSEETNAANGSESAPAIDEISLLKTRARMMGIPFSNNIGLETLKAKIQEKMDGTEAPPVTDGPVANPLAGQTEAPVRTKTLFEYLQETEMALVRVRITCMDPKKKDLQGEIFTVANEHLGTVRKFIPFGEVTDDGFHVPMCLYRMLEARRFLNIRTRRGPNGQDIVESNYAKEFALEVLDPLTPEELKRLATAQLAAGVFAD